MIVISMLFSAMFFMYAGGEIGSLIRRLKDKSKIGNIKSAVLAAFLIFLGFYFALASIGYVINYPYNASTTQVYV
jgi:disulfide bond formation protein DsbB